MNIRLETIPQARQRYPTTGDWWWEGDTLEMRVSAIPDWRSSMLVALHELVKALLCKAHGVTAEAVDAWDTGIGKDLDDPGDDTRALSPRASHRIRHRASTGP